MAMLGRHFQDEMPEDGTEPGLLPEIDAAIARTIAEPERGDARREVLHALVGIRRAMFQAAPGFSELPLGPLPEPLKETAG
jgi:hypothetical protein